MRILIALVMLSSTPAIAQPTLEVLDRGIAVEVIARDVKATSTAIVPVRSRLEIAIDGRPSVPVLAPNDPTIHSIEMSGSTQRVLSVKLDLDRAQVKNLARFAQVIQVGNDVHLLVPRALPAPGAGVMLPEPTLPPELAATLEGPAAIAPVAPEPTLEAAPSTAPPPPAVEPDAKPGPVATPATATVIASSAPPLAPVSNPKTPANKLSLFAGLGLVGLGIAAWLVRRRKSLKPQGLSIDVIAQRSLGAKAKIVWLTAGGREMVIAVTPQAVRMLGQWRTTESSGSGRLPEATALAPAVERPLSPAVSGILKLRGKTAAPLAVTDEVMTDDVDADALWAKEILAATGARR